ncbi:cytochrome c oxidase subunit 4 [Propionibacteriaceae bacterium G1746]|uniref:cytochrome c oxidase subunit 4 n=1 Tax=Aestuariimicrobium sp. G57 TaxID=3418485 RepID=UPI003C218C44
MKTEQKIFGALVLYFVVVGAAYYVMSKELVGTVALGLSAVMCAIITVYLGVAGKSTGKRLEDDVDAEIYQGAGTLGFFAPKSIWPLWVAITLSLIALGPPLGWWLTIVGFGVAIWSISGWVFEFYRGDYAH